MTQKPKMQISLDTEQRLLLEKYLNDEISLREVCKKWDDKYPQKTLNHISNIIKALYQQGDIIWKD